MKKGYKLMAISALLLLIACKKQEAIKLDAGSVNITNAVVGGSAITLIADQSIVTATNTVAANGSAILPVLSSQKQLIVGVPAAATPAVIYYNQPISISNQTTYSLFLTGPSPSAIESVLIRESYPYAYQDSVCGVRFINLAQGNTPLMINLKGSANGSEAASVAYKAYTDFKQYPAKKLNPNYIFEFRKLDGTLITSYTLVTPYFHNVTLALRGTIGGSTGVILNNDY